MKIEEYISSGVLEAFVLGELSEKEEQEVMAMAEKHPEVRKELDLIEGGLEDLAFKSAIKPSAHVKDNLFKSIEKSDEPSSDKLERKVIAIEKPTHNHNWKYLAAASVSLAIISSILAYNYWNKWQNSEEQLNTLIAQNEQVANDYNQVNQQLNQIEKDLSIINNTAYQRIAMKGTDNAPQGLAYIYWNNNSQEVYLSVQQLKSLTEEKQYQLWAIIDGKPVDAGVFELNNNTALVKMKNIGQGASAFAVTIEPKGGSKNPTLETMQVMGPVKQG